MLLVLFLRPRLGLLWCASYWTRPPGGGRWEHHLCNLWKECLAAHKTAQNYFGTEKGSFKKGMYGLY